MQYSSLLSGFLIGSGIICAVCYCLIVLFLKILERELDCCLTMQKETNANALSIQKEITDAWWIEREIHKRNLKQVKATSYRKSQDIEHLTEYLDQRYAKHLTDVDEAKALSMKAYQEYINSAEGYRAMEEKLRKEIASLKFIPAGVLGVVREDGSIKSHNKI